MGIIYVVNINSECIFNLSNSVIQLVCRTIGGLNETYQYIRKLINSQKRGKNKISVKH